MMQSIVLFRSFLSLWIFYLFCQLSRKKKVEVSTTIRNVSFQLWEFLFHGGWTSVVRCVAIEDCYIFLENLPLLMM